MTEFPDEQLGLLAEQQAALRRVATLVARGVDHVELFQAVAQEMARQLGAEVAAVWQYERDGSAVLLAISGDADARVPIGSRITSGDANLLATVRDSGRPARHDNIDTDDAPGSTVARLREIGIRHAATAPIVVDGRVWGAAVVASSGPEPLPTHTEERLDDFSDLMATAIANAAARGELQASRDRSEALAEQQAALRRVATLVARGAGPSEVFSAVAEEMARCLHVENASVMRFESDTAAVVLAVAAIEPRLQRTQVVTEIVGTRLTLEGDNTAMMVLRTGRPSRIDSFENATGSLAETVRGMGLRAGVSVPIVVGGRVWGTV